MEAATWGMQFGYLGAGGAAERGGGGAYRKQYAWYTTKVTRAPNAAC